MSQKVTINFRDVAHLATAESILNGACGHQRTSIVVGGDSIGITVEDASEQQLDRVRHMAKALNAIVDEHSDTFTVLVAEPALH